MGTMLAIYLGSLLFGGFFVGASVLSGMHASEHGHDAILGSDALEGPGALDGHLSLPEHVHLDMNTEMGALPEGEVHVEHVTDLVSAGHGSEVAAHQHGLTDVGAAFAPVRSLRFWTFGTCFFGMTGSLMTLLGVAGLLTFAMACGVGLGSGLAATWVVHKLSREHVSAALSEADYPGTIGRVMVTIQAGRPGKIRCHLRGQVVDLIAESDEKGTLRVGQQVLVIEYREGAARVVHAGRLGRLREL